MASLNQKLNRGILYLIPLCFMLLSPWQLSEVAIATGYGKHLWADFHFLYHSSLNLLPTDNNVTCAWLPSLIYYSLFSLGGFTAIAVFHAVVLLGALAVLYSHSLFINPWPWRLADRLAVYFGFLGSCSYYSFRPALLAFVPFILCYVLIEKAQGHLKRKDWLALMALQVAWVNVHASFVLLPIMLFWSLATQRPLVRRDWAGFTAVVAATLVNPFGYQIYPYLIKTRQYSTFLGISEWASTFSNTYLVLVICFWALFAALLVLLVRFRKPIWSSAYLPLGVIPLAGLRTSVFALFAFPVFLRYRLNRFRHSNAAPKSGASLIGSLTAFVAIAALCLLGFPFLKTNVQDYLPAKVRPLYDDASVFAIAQKISDDGKPTCAVMNDFNVGSFLLLMTPNPLLIDARTTPFTFDAVKTYVELMAEPDRFFQFLNESQACYVVLSERTHTELITKLQSEQHFRPEVSENGYLLLMR